MSKNTSEKSTSAYISNPFLLAHNAAKRLYKNNRTWAIILIVLGVLNTISSTNQNTSTSTDTTTSSSPELSFALIVFLLSMGILFLLLMAIVSTYLTGIISYITLQSEKGKNATLSEAFEATKERFWRLLSAMLLAGLKIFGWTLLFIIPGIIAALRYTLLSYVIMDDSAKKTSVKEAHDQVKTLVNGRLWEIFGVSFTGIIPFIGTLYSTAGNAGLYQQLKAYNDKKLEKPAIHWLNYAFALLMFVVSIAVLYILTALVLL